MDKARSDELFAKLIAPVTIAFFIGVAIAQAVYGFDFGELVMKALGFILYGSVFAAIAFFVIAAIINIIGRIFR